MHIQMAVDRDNESISYVILITDKTTSTDGNSYIHKTNDTCTYIAIAKLYLAVSL